MESSTSTKRISVQIQNSLKLQKTSHSSKNKILKFIQVESFALNQQIIQDAKTPPSMLTKTIQEIINTPTSIPKKSIFKFKNNEKAAVFNSKLFQSISMNFKKTINAQENTFLLICSEFRFPHLLEKLFSKQHRWKKMKTILSEGAQYSFKDDISYSEESRLNDLKNAIKKGTNASAKVPENFNALSLWKFFLLESTQKGTRIDHITFAIPQYFTISDTCSFGMGGFTSEGLAWRWNLPENLFGKLTVNLLEFLGSIITIFISLKFLNIKKFRQTNKNPQFY